MWASPVYSPSFEQEDGNLSCVEIYEVLSFMCDEAAKVAAHYAVPGRVVLCLKFSTDE